MQPSGWCVRCRQPLAADAAGGLCPACARADATRSAPPPDPPPTTLSHRPPDAPDPTRTIDHTREPGDSTTPNRGPRRSELPVAPPGYELVERLGGGGMGTVYRAREHAAERTVAMKFLNAPAGPAALERFLVEIRSLARLDHENIVRVLAVDVYRADPFFTMEYAPGGSLADRVAESGPLEPAEAARLVATVARAVAAAHAAGVIHRDLKPSNILLRSDEPKVTSDESGQGSSLVTRHPSPVTPLVSDFGLAKRTDRDDDLTQGSGALGTPHFMPPEQTGRGFGEVGPHSDVYGLGATLYYLLTGRPPFVGEPHEVIAQVRTDPPARPRSLRPEVPPALEGVVLKCLEKKPADRYPGAVALADDLDRFLAGRAVAAPPLTRWRRLRRWTRRHRVRLVAAAAGVVVLAVVLARDGRPPEPPAPPDPLPELRRELAEDGAATVIPERGLPRWHRMRLGENGPTEAPAHENACFLESTGHAMMDVLPAVGPGRYRVTLQIKQVRVVEPANPKAAPPMAFVGVYLADDPVPGPDGVVLTPLLAVTYYDFERIAQPAPSRSAAILRDVILTERPGKTPGDVKEPIAQHFFQPSPAGGTGTWRTVRLEVTPDSVGAAWQEPDGTFAPFKPVPRAVTPPTRQAWLAGRMDRIAPGTGALAPAWDPGRLTVGIWCHRGGVAARRCVVERTD